MWPLNRARTTWPIVGVIARPPCAPTSSPRCHTRDRARGRGARHGSGVSAPGPHIRTRHTRLRARSSRALLDTDKKVLGDEPRVLAPVPLDHGPGFPKSKHGPDQPDPRVVRLGLEPDSGALPDPRCPTVYRASGCAISGH